MSKFLWTCHLVLIISPASRFSVQLQKMAGGLKFQILEIEGLCYLCSEKKSADQLRCNCTADLHLCYRIEKKAVKAGFPMTWLIIL